MPVREAVPLLRRLPRLLRGLVENLLYTAIVMPLLLLYRIKCIRYEDISACISLVPFGVGLLIRRRFYRKTLRLCGRNVLIGFGAVLTYPDITLGDNVLINKYCVLGHVDIGDDVLIGSHACILSGGHQHGAARLDIPIREQPGQVERTAVGRDVWIGAHSVVMRDIGEKSVIGAGSVVTRPVPPYTVAAGNPARTLRHRENPSEPERIPPCRQERS
ncbi:MAG: acyltransferase [Armatimonadetes bacterium]|nr:acyltransferase [Armatimonadota bacterium]